MFRPNPTMVRELEAQAAVRAELLAAAEKAKRHVEAMAPRGKTGDYARSIIVTPTATGAAVGSRDPFAHLVEFGSANNPPYAPLRRGVRAAGFRLVEEPKGSE